MQQAKEYGVTKYDGTVDTDLILKKMEEAKKNDDEDERERK